MTVQNKTLLKSYFNTGDIPTESNFVDLVDSMSPWTVAAIVAASNASNRVKAHADYVCDGTDDNVEIAAALAALPTGGGQVSLSEGTFVIGASLAIPDFSTLAGCGFNTVIQAKNSLNANMITLEDENVEQIILRDFRMYGNRSQQTSGHAIYLDNTGGSFSEKDANHRLFNLNILWAKGDGVHLTGSGNAPSSQMTSVFVFYVDGNGFVIDTSDAKLTACETGESGLRGILISAAACQLSNCKSYLSGRITGASGQGVLLSAGRTQLSNCQAQDNRSHGFQFIAGGVDTKLSNCMAESNGVSGATANGFQFTAGTRQYLTCCVAQDIRVGAARGQDNGFRIESGLDYIFADGYTINNISNSVSNASGGGNIDVSGVKDW